MKMTKTEAVRRVRIMSGECRRILNVGDRSPVHIGLRQIQQSTAVPPASVDEATALCCPAGDDLAEFVTFGDYASTAEWGDVLHLYVHGSGGFTSELKDVIVVWLGTPKHEPRIIDPRFRIHFSKEN
jgi:hypothetical protein